jgi:hypothetical protein
MAKAKKAPKGEIEIRPVFRKEIAEPMTEAEANAVYQDAHRKRSRADELEEELAQHTGKRKAEIKELRGDADRLDAQAYDNKKLVWREVREVLRGSQVFVVRIDNDAVVDQRAATPSELQQDFPGLDRGAALPTPSAAGGSSDDDQEGDDRKSGDDDPEPTVVTPPGGAPRLLDDELEADPGVGSDGPRSAVEGRTRAPRKRGPGKAPAATSKSKARSK